MLVFTGLRELLTFNYAVLRLSESCPPGTFAFSRRIDNEDESNKNFSSGDRSVAPNQSTDNTHFQFCFVPAAGQGWDTTGVPWSQNSGSFARQPSGQSLKSYTFGNAFTDDEDEDNKNTLSGHTQNIIQPEDSNGKNTRFYTAYQTGATRVPRPQQCGINVGSNTASKPSLPGDLDSNGCVDRADANRLLVAIRRGTTDPAYDLNVDGHVNRADARKLVTLFTNPEGASCP